MNAQEKKIDIEKYLIIINILANNKQMLSKNNCENPYIYQKKKNPKNPEYCEISCHRHNLYVSLYVLTFILLGLSTFTICSNTSFPERHFTF